MVNTRVHAIIGNPDTGKTLTAWLLYFLLKEKGKVEFFHVFTDGKYIIPDQSGEPLNKIATYQWGEETKPYDFCATILIGKIRVAIFSAGDNAHAIQTAFTWFIKVDANVLICCSRSNFNSYARSELHKYENEYPISLYRIYRDYENGDMDAACEKRKALATEIAQLIESWCYA